MQNSDEIKAVMEKIYQAMSEGNAQAFANLLSREPGTLVIGTDPREWWAGFEVINHFFGTQIKEMGGTMQIESSGIESFREGSVGWSADRAIIKLNDGTNIPFRGTSVLHQEGNEWKLVQWHVSVGADNEEVVGKELTV